MALPTQQARLQLWIMAVLIVLLAALLAWLSTRSSFVSDWSRAGRHSLSAASVSILEQMPDAIEISAYAREEPQLRELIRSFVSRYQRHKTDISLDFINPDAVPDEVRNLGIRVNGELVLRYRDRLEHVRSESEQEFSNALQRLLRESDQWLAFIEGHGERSPLDQESYDISVWGQHLQSRGLSLQPFNLARFTTVPDNTSVLVIASPRTEFLPGEAGTIIEFLQAGGNLLWLTDPGYSDGLDPLRQYLGVAFAQGTIIDIAGQVIGIDDPTITLATRQLYTDHPAVNGFDQTTLFPHAAALQPDQDSGWQAVPLVTSSTHTWLERGSLQGQVGFDEATDALGPFNLALALERQAPNANSAIQRVVVIGDSDFITNAYIDNNGNLELGQRLVEWLLDDDSFIDIPARTAEDAQLELSSTMAIIIGVGLLIVIPAGLCTTGIVIWWRRRRL